MIASLERLALRACQATMIFALALMLALVFSNVVLRYAFDSGIAASEEIARILFIWCTFVGAIVALDEHVHIGIDGIRPHLPPRLRGLVDILALTLLIGVTVVMLIGSVAFLQGNLGGRTPILEIPMSTAFAALIVSALGMTAVFLIRLWAAVRSFWSGTR